MLVKTTDGTPDAVKVARPVWSGGKSGDNFNGLPITIGGAVSYTHLVAVYRVNKNRGYTVMANFHLRDKSLSLKEMCIRDRPYLSGGWRR